MIDGVELEGLETKHYTLNLNQDSPKLQHVRTDDWEWLDDDWELDLIKVKVLGPKNSEIAYTFTPFAAGSSGQFCRGCGSGNYIEDFSQFSADPVAAINSGQYSTDSEILGDMVYDMAIFLVLRRTGGSLRVPTTGTVPVTRVNNTTGWKVGQPINNRTSAGNVPKWNTVRARHWKNRAHNAKPGEFNESNLARMKKGRAPQQINEKGELESMELHHDPPQREGGLFDFEEVWPDEHALKDKHRKTGR